MNVILASSINDQIRQAISDIAEALLYPVLVAALITLLMVAYELGRLGVEAFKRSQRPKTPFQQTARQAFAQAHAGDAAGAQASLKSYSYGKQLQTALVGTLFAQTPIDAQRSVIEYDLHVSKRLDRVRLLVRAGPAIGLMGTLIPLAPALSALGKGQPNVLADELQTAFAVTVVGVLVGLVAFAVAIVRERFFTRDLTDLEFLRELRGDSVSASGASAVLPAAAPPAQAAQTDEPAATAVAPAAAPAAAAKPAAAKPAAATPPPAAAGKGATPTPPPAVPAPAAGTPPPAAPGSTAHQQPSVPAVPPPAQPAPRKRFGLKRKSKKADEAAPAFPPPPPAPTPPPAAGQPGGKADAKPDAKPGEGSGPGSKK